MSDNFGVAITGVSGFLGRHLYNHLSKCGFRLVGTFRKSTVISPLKGISVDFSLPESRNVKLNRKIDTLVHLAGLAHDLTGRFSQADYFLHNTEATLNAVYFAHNNKIKRFVLVSSLSVYDSLNWNVSINHTTKESPQTSYGLSKLRAEKVALAACQELGLEYVCIRPALVVGEGAPGNLQRLEQWVDRFPLIPAPFPENQRSFLHINHFCTLIGQVVNFELKPEGQQSNCALPMNTFIASSEPSLSTKTLVQSYATGKGKRVFFLTLPQGLFRLLARIPKLGSKLVKVWGNLNVDSTLTAKTFSWDNRWQNAEQTKD